MEVSRPRRSEPLRDRFCMAERSWSRASRIALRSWFEAPRPKRPALPPRPRLRLPRSPRIELPRRLSLLSRPAPRLRRLVLRSRPAFRPRRLELRLRLALRPPRGAAAAIAANRIAATVDAPVAPGAATTTAGVAIAIGAPASTAGTATAARAAIAAVRAPPSGSSRASAASSAFGSRVLLLLPGTRAPALVTAAPALAREAAQDQGEGQDGHCDEFESHCVSYGCCGTSDGLRVGGVTPTRSAIHHPLCLRSATDMSQDQPHDGLAPGPSAIGLSGGARGQRIRTSEAIDGAGRRSGRAWPALA